jgi:hypothetical protein
MKSLVRAEFLGRVTVPARSPSRVLSVEICVATTAWCTFFPSPRATAETIFRNALSRDPISSIRRFDPDVIDGFLDGCGPLSCPEITRIGNTEKLRRKKTRIIFQKGLVMGVSLFPAQGKMVIVAVAFWTGQVRCTIIPEKEWWTTTEKRFF